MHPNQYPIGPFQAASDSSYEAIIERANEVPKLVEHLRSLVDGLDEEQLATPYRPGGWTIRQVVHHLADNDMNAYLRFKRGLTEQAPMASSYREELWADLIDYEQLPVSNSLSLLGNLHERFFVLLQGLTSEDYERTIQTAVLGVITLDVALQRWLWHHRHHAAQIENLLRTEGWKL